MNRLAKEKSPYLLQHAKNPVEWYPWGDEAFEKAAREDKPVLVSVGYSTCHWCHVMEKESFEDSEVAALMNDTFVSVKVDREERPDIDGVLMSVCQIISQGNCGWPLNVVMTPEKKPFFAATYIPKHNKYNRAGMVELIPRLSELWKTRRPDIEKSAGEIADAIQNSQTIMQSEGKMSADEMLKNGFAQLAMNFDPVFGGFGNAPKFPSPHNLIFLTRHWKRTGESKALEMAEKTLGAMLNGGINDHIGFGFHRYSTDRRWLVPHFEKMLYDQALISLALTELWLATQKPAYREGAEKTLQYVMRDLTDRSGGFFCAEDADSEGEEGKFYVWSAGEFGETIGNADGDEARFAAQMLNIKSGGNFVDEATGETPGTNIPHITEKISEAAGRFGISEKEAAQYLESAREKLFAAREKRPRPHRDDKILTDWNGLMMAAFAKAGPAFGEEKYIRAAEKAANFITGKMLAGGELLHRFRGGEAGIAANLDDYAFTVWGLLELYEAGFDTSWLEPALYLNDKMMELFSDSEKGAFFFTSVKAEHLIARKKEMHDGAIPCGNSVAVMNLMKISRITGNSGYRERALEIVHSLSLSIEKIPSSHTMLLCAVEFEAGKTTEIVIASDSRRETKTVTDALAKNYDPGTTVLLKETGDKAIERIAPFVRDCKTTDGKAAVYICEDETCGLPVGAEEFAQSCKN